MPPDPTDSAAGLPGGVAVFGSNVDVPKRRRAAHRIASIRLRAPCHVVCQCGQRLDAPDPASLNLAYGRHGSIAGDADPATPRAVTTPTVARAYLRCTADDCTDRALHYETTCWEHRPVGMDRDGDTTE